MVYRHIAIQIAQLYVFDLLASGVIVTKAVSDHDAIIWFNFCVDNHNTNERNKYFHLNDKSVRLWLKFHS